MKLRTAREVLKASYYGAKTYRKSTTTKARAVFFRRMKKQNPSLFYTCKLTGDLRKMGRDLNIEMLKDVEARVIIMPKDFVVEQVG